MPSVLLLMRPESTYSPLEMQAAKKRLVETRVSPTTDVAQFHAQFLCIWASLNSHHSIDSDTVVALDTLAICLTRALALARCIPEYSSYHRNPLLSDIFHYICEHHRHGGGAYTNAISGLLTKLLQLMDYVADSELRPPMLGCLEQHVMSMHADHKGFYAIAEASLKEVQGFAQLLHASNSRLPSQCLEIMWSGALANSAARTFAAYHCQLHHPKKEPALYIQSWTVNVEDKLSNETLRQNIIDHLLPHLFKAIPTLFSGWAKKLHFQSMAASWRELKLAVLKKGSQLSLANDPILTGVMDQTELTSLLDSPDERTRLAAFSLAASAINASKGCPEYALEIVGDVELLNSLFKESTGPESRSAFLSVFRRALVNMKEFVGTIESRSEKKRTSTDLEMARKYTSSLQSIFAFVSAQLTPDSSYAQLAMSLEVLKAFSQEGFDGIPRQSKAKPVKVLEIFTPKFTNTLLRFTTNNYDDIRLQATSVLADCPNVVFIQVLNNDSLQQTLVDLQSFKGRVSDMVTHLVLTVFSILQQNANERSVDLLHVIFEKMGTVMESSPLEMHGYFSVWASILPIAEVNERNRPLFQTVISTLFSSIEEIWDKMKPSMKRVESTIPEVLDSKYWRVVKESALLLKSIMVFNKTNSWRFFDTSKMPSICQLLIDQLTTMTHRGAFASISSAFVTTCEICFGHTSLSEYPKTIIDQTLSLLTARKQLITRRSAGIPFVLCGVLNAARCDEAKLEQLSTLVFNKLDAIATTEFASTGNETHDIPQVHALNCIRQLFKEASLDAVTRKHTNEALRLSLTYLNNSTWSVKNSALMLFTALHEKLFGTQKLGDMLPSVNASLFFSRYQGISDILLSMLKDSEQGNVNNIVSVLAIVSRLKVNSENDTILGPFIDVLSDHYLCHEVWKVREMAARSIANMVHKSRYCSEISGILQNLRTFSKNKQHGCLLYVSELIAQAGFSKTNLEDYAALAAQRFNDACSGRHDSDIIISRACLQVMMTKNIRYSEIQKVHGHVVSLLQFPQTNGAISLFLDTATTAVLENSTGDWLIEASKFYMTCHKYEVQAATCRYFLDHAEDFTNTPELHSILFHEISIREHDHIKGLMMDLALKANISPEYPLIKPNCGEKESLKYDILALRQNPGSGISLNKPSHLASVDVKILHATVMKELINHKRSDKEKVELILSRFIGLSDDSPEVRELSCLAGKNLQSSRKYLLAQALEMQTAAAPLMAEEIRRSVCQNIQDFKKNSDLERTNTFVNEVQDTKDLLGVIKVGETGDQAELLDCVEMVLQTVKENVHTFQSYIFNVHLHTAVAKALEIAAAMQDESSVAKIHQYLEATNYPI